ncbi:hypothetical protein PCE1_001578 [Barthelona sp. PCE]
MNTILVRNVSSSVTESMIHEFFSSCGDITNVTVLNSEEERKALVEFQSQESALSAMNFSGFVLVDTIITVELPEDTDFENNNGIFMKGLVGAVRFGRRMKESIGQAYDNIDTKVHVTQKAKSAVESVGVGLSKVEEKTGIGAFLSGIGKKTVEVVKVATNRVMENESVAEVVNAAGQGVSYVGGEIKSSFTEAGAKADELDRQEGLLNDTEDMPNDLQQPLITYPQVTPSPTAPEDSSS